MFKKLKLVSVFALTVLFTVNTIGQANKLGDLVNSRASTGESQLEARGYHLTHISSGDDASWGYWWNPSSRHCVSVVTFNGRYATIKDTVPLDCNQKDTKNNTGRNAAIGVGIGAAAAAIIGAAIISHKSHHHDSNEHHNSVNNEAEYERGYRAGLHNAAYHNYSNTQYYKNGYEAGVKQRSYELRHESQQGLGGYAPHVYVKDLAGKRRQAGNQAMESRGFRNVDNLNSGNTRYEIWYNNQTRQCIQVGIANGQYDSVFDIGRHPKCLSGGNVNRPNENIWTLRGVEASSGDPALKSRGFRDVDGFTTNDAKYTIWFNRDTRQCIQVETINGRYNSIINVRSHRKCR